MFSLQEMWQKSKAPFLQQNCGRCVKSDDGLNPNLCLRGSSAPSPRPWCLQQLSRASWKLILQHDNKTLIFSWIVSLDPPEQGPARVTVSEGAKVREINKILQTQRKPLLIPQKCYAYCHEMNMNIMSIKSMN